MFREFFFGYLYSAATLGYACKNLGGLGPLVWAKKGSAPTVVKGLAKLLYRLVNLHQNIFLC
jgi:hypothetical protein